MNYRKDPNGYNSCIRIYRSIGNRCYKAEELEKNTFHLMMGVFFWHNTMLLNGDNT